MSWWSKVVVVIEILYGLTPITSQSCPPKNGISLVLGLLRLGGNRGSIAHFIIPSFPRLRLLANCQLTIPKSPRREEKISMSFLRFTPTAARRLATPSTFGSKSSLSETLALLPPLQLYRRILRVHRKKLDPEMRILGDGYVKSEFRAHRNVDNPLHIVYHTHSHNLVRVWSCGLLMTW